jgi:hypothetical protein
MKTAGLRIRVEPSLRDSFVNICRANDQTAAQVIRSFMRNYIAENKGVASRNVCHEFWSEIG